jgi:hypothetical protein
LLPSRPIPPIWAGLALPFCRSPGGVPDSEFLLDVITSKQESQPSDQVVLTVFGQGFVDELFKGCQLTGAAEHFADFWKLAMEILGVNAKAMKEKAVDGRDTAFSVVPRLAGRLIGNSKLFGGRLQLLPVRVQDSDGRGDAIVVEHSDTVKTYLVRWNGVKIDLTKLAKLRWIEKLKTPELCSIFGRRRSAIRQSIRTLRNSGLSGLNLTFLERNTILEQIKLEDESFGEMRAKWRR